MSVDERIDRLGREARMRRVAIVALAGAPLVVAVAAIAARESVAAAFAVASAGVALVAALGWRAARAIGPAWIARRLDAASSALEDSSDLLFRAEPDLSPLQRLQRQRLRERIERDAVAGIAPPWPRPLLAVAWTLATVAIGVAVFSPRPARVSAPASASRGAASQTTQVERARLEIAAPAYTQLPPRTETGLEARVVEGARVRWTLRFAPTPRAAALVFHDGSRVELARDGEEWSGERALSASTLYRIALDGAPALEDDRLRRIDVVADRAPDVRVIQPDKSLTLLADGQRAWDLAFEASDDYGIAAATLSIALAQGTGENIAFKEQTVALSGEDLDAAHPGRHLGYRHSLDLAALGIAQGDDVIVKLAVNDRREPEPNTTKSASFILRWPPEASSDSVGMEGLVQKTMPAYFRSQRQIIIDTEALVAEKASLDAEHLLARSDSIGVDQKILRLRYGQFLGEEFETKSAPANPAEHADEHAEATQADALTKAEHEHGANAAPKFGDLGDVMAEYGHTHDHAEAATLLDPETKAILKSALGEMWDAELHLRQGRPDEALPYERKALEYIKEVQQSTRIYLARVGLELPAVDEGRRLSGDRKGVTDRESALAPADAADVDASAFWNALDAAGAFDADAFERWVHAHAGHATDALALLAASDRVRREPACEDCRRQLRALLWPLLPQPAAAVALRRAPDASGRAYLDALAAPRVKGAGP